MFQMKCKCFLQVTDEADHFFLYVLDLGDIDFHALKREQSILVDLPAFPDKLAALLRLCEPPTAIATAPAESSRASNSQFSARLDGSSGLFSIVESNEFKNLTHISLQMRPANDATLKAYLSSRLALSTNLSMDQARQIEELQRSVADLSRQLGTVSEELSDARYVHHQCCVAVLSAQCINAFTQESTEPRCDNG
jgi:spindle assembly abnormal protein 6